MAKTATIKANNERYLITPQMQLCTGVINLIRCLKGLCTSTIHQILKKGLPSSSARSRISISPQPLSLPATFRPTSFVKHSIEKPPTCTQKATSLKESSKNSFIQSQHWRANKLLSKHQGPCFRIYSSPLESQKGSIWH